jgi:hypothetical protein
MLYTMNEKGEVGAYQKFMDDEVFTSFIAFSSLVKPEDTAKSTQYSSLRHLSFIRLEQTLKTRRSA